MHAQVNTVLAILSELLFLTRNSLKTPLVLPESLPMGTMSLLQPTGITAISVSASRAGNVLQFPRQLASGFTDLCVCARACGANCQYGRRCRNEALKGQLFLTRGTHCVYPNSKGFVAELEWL